MFTKPDTIHRENILNISHFDTLCTPSVTYLQEKIILWERKPWKLPFSFSIVWHAFHWIVQSSVICWLVQIGSESCALTIHFIITKFKHQNIQLGKRGYSCMALKRDISAFYIEWIKFIFCDFIVQLNCAIGNYLSKYLASIQ